VFGSSYGEERIPANNSMKKEPEDFDDLLPRESEVQRVDFCVCKYQASLNKRESAIRFLHSLKIYGRNGRLLFN
jgi:hypothetical protein